MQSYVINEVLLVVGNIMDGSLRDSPSSGGFNSSCLAHGQTTSTAGVFSGDVGAGVQAPDETRVGELSVANV